MRIEQKRSNSTPKQNPDRKTQINCERERERLILPRERKNEDLTNERDRTCRVERENRWCGRDRRECGERDLWDFWREREPLRVFTKLIRGERGWESRWDVCI